MASLEVLVIDCPEQYPFWLGLRSPANITFASTPAKALGTFSQNTDLVFLGTRLPGKSSIDVLRTIRNWNPSVHVIIVAEHKEDCTCLDAFRQGAWDYMRKPLKSDDVLRKIQMLRSLDRGPGRRATTTWHREDYPDVPSHFVHGVLNVRNFLIENYSASLTLAAACRMARISRTYFCQFFKSVTGHSLRSYRNYVKMQIARELLQDKTLSISDVALRLGYDDPNYFSTLYKRIHGLSPSEWQYRNCPDSAGRAAYGSRKQFGKHLLSAALALTSTLPEYESFISLI